MARMLVMGYDDEGLTGRRSGSVTPQFGNRRGSQPSSILNFYKMRTGSHYITLVLDLKNYIIVSSYNNGRTFIVIKKLILKM